MSLVVLGSSPSTSNIPMNLCCPFHFSCWKNILLAASLSHFQDAPHLIYAPSLRCVSMSKISFCTAVINDFIVIKASSVLPQGPVRNLLIRSSWIIVAEFLVLEQNLVIFPQPVIVSCHDMALHDIYGTTLPWYHTTIVPRHATMAPYHASIWYY